MEPVYEEYLGYLDELSKLLVQMTETAKNKAAAAREGDLVKVDGCMKQEQVYSMTLRSMDQRRDKMLRAMGISGTALSQLADHYPPPMQARAAKAAELAMSRFESYMSASNMARTSMEIALREIARMFPQDQPAPAEAREDPPPRMKTDFRA